MTTKAFLRRYWRIPLIALLGGLIAFAGSFLVQETYASSTRLLIRGRDTTFLTTSGQPISDAPGLIDAGMSKSLAETYAGTATSREVATMVVDDLGLDAPKPDESGPVAWFARTLATTYKCSRAFVTSGFCADAEPREEAIQTVQGGLMAAQLGPESGAAAGQANSYIVELVGSGDSPQQARDVTNTAADATIQTSLNRSRQDAQTHADALGTQVGSASTAVGVAATNVSNFQVEHGITDLDLQKVAAVTTATDTRNQLASAQDDLAGARAELASVNATLAGLDPQASTNERLTTGRSETSRESNGPSPLYNDVAVQQAAAAGKVADLEGKVSSLQGRLDGGSTDGSTLTGDQADLLQLEQTLDLAQSNLDTLTKQQQQAQVNVGAASVELTRLDEAGTPTYPIAPKRYLYLALGLLLGGLAGGGLTWLVRRRQLDDDAVVDGEMAPGRPATADPDVDLRQAALPADERERVPVGSGVSGSSGSSVSGMFNRVPGNGNGNGGQSNGDVESP